MGRSYQIAADFERARRRGVLAIRRRDNALLPFDEIRCGLRARAQHHAGLRALPSAQIVGTVSRYRDFVRALLPRQTSTKARWLSSDRAYYEDIALSPIELYQVGETYFVTDGNHRVSVWLRTRSS